MTIPFSENNNMKKNPKTADKLSQNGITFPDTTTTNIQRKKNETFSH